MPSSGFALRIAVLGAFPFPLFQGSQVFARDQALALGAAGASITLLCYGSGAGEAPRELDLVRVPHALSPRALRAGPSLGKPIADAALVAAYARAHRERGFDIALAHNAEAALVALAGRVVTSVPVIYVAHTLAGHELASYGPHALAGALDIAGRGLDRFLGARCDGVIALCPAAERSFAAHARHPVASIPPGLDPQPAPSKDGIARVCASHGLEPNTFALYAGNLDPYQDLDVLAEAAARLPGTPVVAATHAESQPRLGAVRIAKIANTQEGRALLYGAAVAVLPRRDPGGFPIKLLNYMEAARPIVLREGLVDGLEHDHNAWLVPPEATPRDFAEAIDTLCADRTLAARLGTEARATLEKHHAWPELAHRILAFVTSVLSRST